MKKNMKAYLGIDIGSISTKGVIINENNEILAYSYLWTEGNPLKAVKKVLKELEEKTKDQDLSILGVGTTGSARKLIGTMLHANSIKNEITAHAIGTLSRNKEVRTILEIGGQDSKIILLENGIVTDYAMNTLCAAGTGSFLSSQAKRLGLDVKDFGKIALTSTHPTTIAARCTVFAESDLVHKIQMGYDQKDIIAGLCYSVAANYLNNVAKGKKIKSPIIFQGGVSKNEGVKKAFEDLLQEKIITDPNGHLMGALGSAILAKQNPRKVPFSFTIIESNFETTGTECKGCPNHCEVVVVKQNGKKLDAWGNRCPKGAIFNN